MLWNPAAIAAAQATTVSRFGVLNIDGWCLLIIITTSLMVNYCFGLLWLNVSVTASSLF
tara:strand:- start:349 stop:525 length:177 start_codon:yes stop_codon:yes gene_type:complete